MVTSNEVAHGVGPVLMGEVSTPVTGRRATRVPTTGDRASASSARRPSISAHPTPRPNSVPVSAVSGPERCIHDLLPRQCAACKEAAEERGSRKSGPPRRVVRLAEALRALDRAKRRPKEVRRELADRVARAELGLTRAERRAARQIFAAQRAKAARGTSTAEERWMEDRTAGIARSWMISQNVGRGKRS